VCRYVRPTPRRQLSSQQLSTSPNRGARPGRVPIAGSMVEFSFYRFERPLVAFCFFFLFWAYAPPPAPLLVPDEHGVLARFDGTVEVAGVARPFFFGLATAPAHVEDKACARALAPRFSSALTAAAAG